MLHAKSEDTPFWDEGEAKYDLRGERFHVSHYQTDLALQLHAQAQQQAGNRSKDVYESRSSGYRKNDYCSPHAIFQYASSALPRLIGLH